MILSPEYMEFLFRLNRHFSKCDIGAQIAQLGAEYGEVCEAYVLMRNLNPRKAYLRAKPEDVAAELADVIVTAMVGMLKLGFHPEHMLTEQQEKAEGRMNDLTS